MGKGDYILEEITYFKTSLKRFMLYYKFGMAEINTKIKILKEEFEFIHDYNPIEHVKSRLKTPESILKKVRRKNLVMDLSEIRENIRDIAGIRITCSFTTDIYRIAAMLAQQPDIEIVEYKDYIENPKPNGYQSLHLICRIPVFMSDRIEKVYVEIQIRTVAMDFWASLEHKIFYKFKNEGDVPEKIKKDLKDAAERITELDIKMENIHKEISQLKLKEGTPED